MSEALARYEGKINRITIELDDFRARAIYPPASEVDSLEAQGNADATNPDPGGPNGSDIRHRRARCDTSAWLDGAS